MASQMFLKIASDYRIEGREILVEALARKIPIVTVSNHTATIDDPVLHSEFTPYLSRDMTRWGLCTEEICFEKSKLLASVFGLCQTLPIRRGGGIGQDALKDFAYKLQSQSGWVHIYPTGKICQKSAKLPHLGHVSGCHTSLVKWGVGKIVATAVETPLVIPYVHIGMEDVMPQDVHTNKILSPIPRMGKKIRVRVGAPIDMRDLLVEYADGAGKIDAIDWNAAPTPSQAKLYSKITARIEDRLMKMKAELLEDYLTKGKKHE
jgi:monolysocardiolipin acyltransferase